MNRPALQAALVVAGRKLTVLCACVAVVLLTADVRTALLCAAVALPVIAYFATRTYQRTASRFAKIAAAAPVSPDGAPASLRDYDERVVDIAQQLRVAADASVARADQISREYESATAGVQKLIDDIFDTEDRTMARLSRDLHDTVKQTIVELEWILGNDPRARELLRRAKAEIDDVVARTSPIPANGDLAAAVGKLIDDKASSGLDIRIGSWGAQTEATLPRSVATTVFRFFQEGLSNAAKHAPRSRVLISFDITADSVTATVEDNGPGGMTAHQKSGQHYGLTYMEQRATLLDGSVSITSPPGQGTLLELRLPAVSEPAGPPTHG